jgi:hypothetical protein
MPDLQPPPRLRTLMVVCFFVLALAAGAAVAFFQIFSQFQFYDDEGYVMLSVQSYLDGHVLYDEVYTQYGPFYFQFKSVWHAITGWPVSHDMVRLTTIIVWLSAVLLSSLASFRTTKSLVIASAVYLLTFVVLGRIIFEPGHPQELAALLMAALAYSSTLATSARKTSCVFVCFGALVAALSLTKINIGLYAGLALAGAMLSFSSLVRVRQAASWAFIGIAAILPACLMRTHLGVPWGQNYAAVSTCAILAALIVVLFGGRTGTISWKLVAIAGASFVATGTVVLLVALYNGTSPAGLFHGVVGQHLAFAADFSLPADISFIAVPLAICSFVVAIGYCLDQCQLIRIPVRYAAALNAAGAIARVVLVVFICGAAYKGARLSLLTFAGPWIWLALVNPAPTKLSFENILFRRIGVLLVVFEGLQAYPMAGSQLSVATFLAIPVASLCCWDLWRQFQHHKLNVPYGFATAAKVAIYANIAFVWVWLGVDKQYAYLRRTPLNLPGAHWLRLREAQAADIRGVALNLREHGDTFYSAPGMNSFYFWSELKPPTHLNATIWTGLLNENQQSATVAQLERYPRALLVQFGNNVDTIHPDWERKPLSQYFKDRFHPLAQIGLYQLLGDRDRQQSTPLIEVGAIVPARTLVASRPLDGNIAPVGPPDIMFQVRLSKDVHSRAAVSRAVVVDGLRGRVLADSRRGSKKQLEILDARLRPVELPLAAKWLDTEDVGVLYLLPSADWQPPSNLSRAIIRLLDKHGEKIASLPLVNSY